MKPIYLNKAKVDLYNEEAMNNYKRYVFTQEAQDLVKQKRTQRKAEQDQKEWDKAEYRKMCFERKNDEEKKEQDYKQFFKDYEKMMVERGKQHSRRVLSENMEKDIKLNQIQREAEKEYQSRIQEKEAKDQYYHQQKLQDMNTHNKSMLDFKQRIQKQQKREKEQKQLELRKKEENELNLMKVKQKQMKQYINKQYFNDLGKQKALKSYKDKSNKMLTKDELGMNKTLGINAMIPGINNWNTVGSAPMKRKGHSTERKLQPMTEPHLLIGSVGLPKIPSARNSKYQIMKDLEKEYYETSNNSDNTFNIRRLSHNDVKPNVHDVNPYITLNSIKYMENGQKNNMDQMKNKSQSLRY